MKTEIVTALKRRATDIIADLAEDHDPVLITQHGRPAAWLVDVETFEAMQRRTEILEAIARGESAVQDGRTLSHAAAKRRLKRWLPR